jgi:hypothetical protein
LDSSHAIGFPAKMPSSMHRQIIVSGDNALAKTIAEELTSAATRSVKVATAADLPAGVHRAVAVVCAGPNDAINREIALLAGKLSPTVANRITADRGSPSARG